MSPEAALAVYRAQLPAQQTLPLTTAGPAADRAAARHIFGHYRQRQAENTITRQDGDLAVFAAFLVAVQAHPADAPPVFGTDPDAWRGVSWGLVQAFLQWQLDQGYAIGSINVRLSTVKTYAKLATQAGVLSPEDHALIKLVQGYRHVQGKRVDAKRETTRVGHKKAEPTSISDEQARQLKAAGDPQQRLLLCLLLDHGLRVGEACALTARAFNLRRGLLTFYRQKVGKTQTHRLTPDTRAAAEAYLLHLEPTVQLFPSDRRVRKWLARLGVAIGLDRLSPHDCRHYWATAAIAGGTDLKALQDAGGWNSPAMPLRYAESAEIANEGVKLG